MTKQFISIVSLIESIKYLMLDFGHPTYMFSLVVWFYTSALFLISQAFCGGFCSSLIGSVLIMEGAAHNNSSLLPIFFAILSSFVEWPVVTIKPFAELTLWTGRASEPCTAASDEPFLTGQIRAYSPAGMPRAGTARFDK